MLYFLLKLALAIHWKKGENKKYLISGWRKVGERDPQCCIKFSFESFILHLKQQLCTANTGNTSLTGGDKDVKSSIGAARSRDVQVTTSTFSTGLFYREPRAWIYMTMRRWSSGADVIMPSVAPPSDTRADRAGSADEEGAYRPWRV